MRAAGTLISVLVGLASCGGQSPAPQEPDSESSASAFTRANAEVRESDAEMTLAGDEDEETEDSPRASSDALGSSASSNTADQAERPEPEPETKPSRSPRELLTAARLAFMINYPASAPNAAAEQKCAREHGPDLAAKAKCKQQERAEFLADVVLFKKQGNTWWWHVYHRKGETLLELSKNQVEFADVTDDTVTVKLIGKGTGQRPLFISKREVVFRVPSESTVELEDPRYGRLLYEAKIGLVGE